MSRFVMILRNFFMRYPVIFPLLFAGLTFWKWKLISSSLVSMMLTPITRPVSSGSVSNYGLSDLWDYWLAAIAWLLLALMLIKRLVKFLSTKNFRTKETKEYSVVSSVIHRKYGFRILLSFVAIAALAPFIVPFDPSFQGNLQTTRLLTPMQYGAGNERVVLPQESVTEEHNDSGIERLLEQANTVLLRNGNTFDKDNHQAIRLFLLGTDNLGRDIFSRLVYGLRISIFIGVAAMVCAVVLGCLVGFAAGCYGGWIDHLLMRCTDLLLAIPSLFLVIALVAFLGNSTLLLVLVLAGTGWMGVARLIRGEIVSLREREFILAARLLGRSAIRVLADHMLPHVLPIIIVSAVLQLGNVILAEAALSFLGLGIQPPTPSLGNMIGESLPYLNNAWWVGIIPGIVLFSLILMVNIAAERLQKEFGRTL